MIVDVVPAIARAVMLRNAAENVYACTDGIVFAQRRTPRRRFLGVLQRLGSYRYGRSIPKKSGNVTIVVRRRNIFS